MQFYPLCIKFSCCQVLLVKFSQLGSPGGGSGLPAGPSHSESSSEGDSSPGGSPRPRSFISSAGPSREAEQCLPGVILASEPGYVPFLLGVADTGSLLRLPKLREAVRTLLKLVPPRKQCQCCVSAIRMHLLDAAHHISLPMSSSTLYLSVT